MIAGKMGGCEMQGQAQAQGVMGNGDFQMSGLKRGNGIHVCSNDKPGG